MSETLFTQSNYEDVTDEGFVAYLAGYLGHTPAELLARARDIDAFIVDIRFNPHSRLPEWRKGRLESFCCGRYFECPELGNVNYKNGGPIKIKELGSGIEQVSRLAAMRTSKGDCNQGATTNLPTPLFAYHYNPKPQPMILLCACREADTCHRKVVGNALAARGWAVRELDWDGGES